ncbi:hypothetical protein AB4K20DRAFT_1900592 [Rhizopus microsporus]
MAQIIYTRTVRCIFSFSLSIGFFHVIIIGVQPHYLMQEIGQLTFPRSLEELASFVNLKNIRTLLMVTETFWRLCRPLQDEEFWETKRRPTHPATYSLIDSTKDRRRFCALRLE